MDKDIQPEVFARFPKRTQRVGIEGLALHLGCNDHAGEVELDGAALSAHRVSYRSRQFRRVGSRPNWGFRTTQVLPQCTRSLLAQSVISLPRSNSVALGAKRTWTGLHHRSSMSTRPNSLAARTP